MKKWSEPKLVELNLENTKDNGCPESVNFEAEVQGASPFSPNCDKTKPDGSKAYEATSIFNWVCKYYKCGGCTYNPVSTQS